MPAWLSICLPGRLLSACHDCLLLRAAADPFRSVGVLRLAQDTVLFLLEKTEGLSVSAQASDGTTVLHRVAASAVRALEPSAEEAEPAVISPAAGAWLSLLAMLLAHGGGGGGAEELLARDRNDDTALHLLTRCRGPNAGAAVAAWRDAVGEEAWQVGLAAVGADASLVDSILGGNE